MGEAKRKKLTSPMGGAEALLSPPLPQAELEIMGKAIAQVIGAITGAHGADCLMYAGVGAEVLKQMGYTNAKLVIGSAAWRVGPGDGDVISHAAEINTGQSVFAPVVGNVGAGMFHAWIDVGGAIVDFTTASLVDKAAQLDAADGGKTQVDWAPKAVWVQKNQCTSFKEVVNGYSSGVFAYKRHEDLEQHILENHVKGKEHQFLESAPAVQTVMSALRAGHELRVVGLGDGDFQTLESAREASLIKPRKEVELVQKPQAQQKPKAKP